MSLGLQTRPVSLCMLDISSDPENAVSPESVASDCFFTLGVWGLARVRSTPLSGSQPSVSYGLAVPLASTAKAITF